MQHRILLIESSSLMRIFLYNYLGKSFFIQSYENIGKAIKGVKINQKPDIIISNFNEENSSELEDLRNNMFLREVPLMLLASDDKSNQRIEALEMQASDCLSKPFNPKELELRVSNLLELKHPSRLTQAQIAV